MKYKVVYDAPGRIRLRCGAYAFTHNEGKEISKKLKACKGIFSVECHSSNGSILVTYAQNDRQQILNTIASIDKKDLLLMKSQCLDESYSIDTEFKHKLCKMLLKRLIIRPFIPSFIRRTLTLFRAMSYIKQGASQLLQGNINVDVLDAASVGVAISRGSYPTASLIMFLLSLSNLLENYTRKRTKIALTQSLAINVDKVWILKDGVEIAVPLTTISKGDIIRIRTGSIIPVDGLVADGEAFVNESTMTGESLAIMKAKDSVVYAGTVVEDGTISVKVNALADNARISKIIELIDKSEELKAGIQSNAEKLADSIVPWSFFTSVAIYALTRNLNKALSVLMVDFSCAIKLSTPIAVLSAMRESSIHKIMVKGGKFLEEFALADTIVFDKTGTLTNACPHLAKVIPFGQYSEDEVLRIAACLEEHFPHSVARAVVRGAEERNLNHKEEHADVAYVVAHGITSKLHGQRVMIGSPHFIVDDKKIIISQEQQKTIDEQTNGLSTIYLAIGDELVGVLCIDDPPREEAAKTITKLKSMGLSNIIMLTGDSENAAKAVCKQLNITDYRAQILPEDKFSIIENLKNNGHRVIMVGDGINDSPALAAANVSVAMKDASDIAREVADITLLSANLEELVTLRNLSMRLLNRIQFNYRFIVSFNSFLLLSGLAGLISPTVAASLHNLSTMGICITSMKPVLTDVNLKDDKKCDN